MRLHILQHVPFEGPAGIARWATRHGHALNESHLHQGDPPPPLEEFDALVVMGGPMNIFQYRDFPWLRAERDLIQKAIKAGKKVLGICLGAQLIADALGARVVQNPEREIGWHPVHFGAGARLMLRGLPETLTAFHWHGDTFEIPADSVHLGCSPACENQAFMYSDLALGLQFHLEMGLPEITALADACAAELTLPGDYIQTRDQLLNPPPGTLEAATAALDAVLDSFFAP